MLAWRSWNELFLGALAGALLGAVYTQVLSARRAPGGRVYVPLGPFLLLGAFAAIALLRLCRFPFQMSLSHFRCSLPGLLRTQNWDEGRRVVTRHCRVT